MDFKAFLSQAAETEIENHSSLAYKIDMCSGAMMNNLVISLKINATARLSKEAAILDWTGLGIHTSQITSRQIAMDSQSKHTKGKPFATVPNNKYPGEWAGTLLAFICNNFEFYDKLMI
jgi:hypothetical protein